MKNNHISSDLKELLSVKDELCVSLIIPLNEIPTMRRLDKIAIDHAITKLKKVLEQSHEASVVAEFIEKFRKLEGDLQGITGAKGIGIFASSSVFKLLTFPFEVQEKVYTGATFEIRDVLYRDMYNMPYLVLSSTLEKTRLFRGAGGSLTEVEDDNFPAVLSEPEEAIPEYTEGTRNLSATTKREMTLTMESPQAFLNAVDKKLALYFQNHEPLFIAGVQKELAAFESATTHGNRIKGKIQGSYNGYNHAELENKSWQCFREYQLSEEDKLIASLSELFGRELVSIGLPDVWRNAKLGKGNILVVEKDLAQPAFVTGDGFQLWMSKPAEKHEVLSDAIDDLIETVVAMDGRVQFVENGKLAEFNGVAMIHRY